MGARGGTGLGEGSGLPGEEDLFQTGEETGEDGQDEGLQGVGRSPPVRIRACDGAQASKLVGQIGGWCYGYIYN